MHYDLINYLLFIKLINPLQFLQKKKNSLANLDEM